MQKLRNGEREHRSGRAPHAQPQLRVVAGAPCAQPAPTCRQVAHAQLLWIASACSRQAASVAPNPCRTRILSAPGATLERQVSRKVSPCGARADTSELHLSL